MMNRKFLVLLVMALGCLWPARAQSPEPAAVRATLKLADNKTAYRIGDPIRLVLELTADREGYSTDTIPDGTDLTWDTITVTPENGLHYWLEEYLEARMPRDYFSQANLSTKPITIDIWLNDSIRFDRPGRYSVKVTTRRVSFATSPRQHDAPPLILTTNEVAFDLEPMSDADEEKEVKRISELIDASRNWQAEETAARQLAYLTGDISTREKVRRFASGDSRSGNYSQQITYGLFIARNRELVLKLLEAAIRDPNRPVTYSLIGLVAKFRLLRERVGVARKPVRVTGMLMPNGGDPRFVEIQDALVIEIAGSLNRRTGKSLTTTAMTILTRLPKEPEAKAALLAETRQILTSQFDSLHPFDQEYLMRVYWEQLRNPSLIPSLKKMLSVTGVASKNIHDSALKRLIELAPDEARPYVIAEVRDPKSLVDLEVLGSLKDLALDEVDAALVEQIRRLTESKTNFDRVYLKHKTSLAARFATKSIYADMLDIYRNADDSLPVEARPGFLAYFARHNEGEALVLLEQALEKVGPGQQFNILPDFAKLYFSNAVDALLQKRLDTADPEIAGTAAYLISLYGPPADQSVIEQRLRRWHEEWRDRGAEADGNGQGRIERELIMALTRARSWKLSPERTKELQQGCITNICKQNFRFQ
jgi:hypothetical protein